MSIENLYTEIKKRLKDNNIEDCDIIAKEIICYVLKAEQTYLITNRDDDISKDQSKYIYKYVDEIINGKPIQYIINNQEFMGLNFFVNENVLIPQPDTETVVESCLNIINNNKITKVLDLCTGSGAIAISLDKKIKKEDNIKIYGSDISKEALEVAQKNNDILKSNVSFICSDMFSNINDKFDLIVSNPPYIRSDNIKKLPKDVQNEPYIALNGGSDGLDFYRIIKNEAKKYLNKNGYICLEIGFDQAKEVTDLFKDSFKDIMIIKDLSNNDRCIVCKNSD